MSEWHEPKLEDIILDDEDKSFNVHFTDNYQGAVYIQLRLKDVKEVLKHPKKYTLPKLKKRKPSELFD
jgi:hypothetical protein